MKVLYERLLGKVTDTKNARLEAYRRSNRLQSLSTYSISCISALTIASSLYIAVVPNDNLKDFVGLIGVIASLFILIISLIDGSNDYSLKAYLYHKCALDLGPICLRIEKSLMLEKFSEENFDEISNDYQKILDNYSLNHATNDYKLYTWRYHAEFHKDSSAFYSTLMRLFINLKVYLMYYFMISIMCIATIILIIRMYQHVIK